MGGSGYSVAFDPLDGSSIVDANFAVGSIFGIWPGGDLIGRRGADQAAAAYSIYGPRTVLVLAVKTKGGVAVVREYVLVDDVWVLRRDNIEVKSKKIFAPANLRAAADNQAYAELVQKWMSEKYTLRYTGGMVPDVHHILTKGGGIFCSPISPSAPPKLRLLFECAPLAFIMEAAGGASHDGTSSTLERVIESLDIRCPVALGSKSEVAKCVDCLKGS